MERSSHSFHQDLEKMLHYGIHLFGVTTSCNWEETSCYPPLTQILFPFAEIWSTILAVIVPKTPRSYCGFVLHLSLSLYFCNSLKLWHQFLTLQTYLFSVFSWTKCQPVITIAPLYCNLTVLNIEQSDKTCVSTPRSLAEVVSWIVILHTEHSLTV